MKAKLRPNGVVSSQCPDWGSTSNFENRGTATLDGAHEYQGQSFNRILFALQQCAGCGRGALAKVHDNGNWQTAVLESFFPCSQDVARLPAALPADLEAEFREAGLCSSVGANRAASALFRSTLEKTLKANGYEEIAASGFDKMNLQNKIDKATEEGVLTEALRNRAHDEIRVIGNDVLHDKWKTIPDEDVEAAHHYTQRILEAFYDHRQSVEKILVAKKRIADSAAQQATAASPQLTPP